MTGEQRGMAYRSLEAACAQFGRGFIGRRKVSLKLGLSPRACCGWLETGFTPASRVLAMERATGVSKEELRPDLYRE